MNKFSAFGDRSARDRARLHIFLEPLHNFSAFGDGGARDRAPVLTLVVLVDSARNDLETSVNIAVSLLVAFAA